MIVYLAGFKTIEKTYQKPIDDLYILSSYYEHRGGRYGEYVFSDKHMLDSGAYSTFKKPEQARNIDWLQYTKDYISFIKETKQKLFFELDIDGIVGLEKVEDLRKRIEDETGIQPIPVWHSSRKWEYFQMMCEQYPYVAIGTTKANAQGIAIRKNPEILNKFINEARKNKCKIHGLGFTPMKYIDKIKFDSVDSTTWINGQKYAVLCIFKNGRIKAVNVDSTKLRGKNAEGRLLHNFEEWVKFQQYAKLYL